MGIHKVPQIIYKDAPSNIQTQKYGYTTEEVWQNEASNQTRQDNDTGLPDPAYPIDRNTVDTEDTEEQKRKESKGKEKPYVLI